MTTAFEIDAEFTNRVIFRAGLRLYRPADAIDLILRCRDAKVKVLGIDAFLDLSKGVQPSMENSIDFTSERHIKLLEDSWQHAERFVRERASSAFLFEVGMERHV